MKNVDWLGSLIDLIINVVLEFQFKRKYHDKVVIDDIDGDDITVLGRKIKKRKRLRRPQRSKTSA